jgi:hypothetical protein
VVVYIFVDKRSDRIVATTKFDDLLNLTPPRYTPMQKVDVLVVGETPMGFKAIVNGAHWGLFYRAELGAPLAEGSKLEAYVRLVRPDGKLDLCIEPPGYGRVSTITEKILEALKENGGKLAMGDHSSPEEIRERFGTSKKAFKQAVGALLKKRQIAIVEDGIETAKPAPKPGWSAVKPVRR